VVVRAREGRNTREMDLRVPRQQQDYQVSSGSVREHPRVAWMICLENVAKYFSNSGPRTQSTRALPHAPLYRLARICSKVGGSALALIDEGGKFLGRPRGEGVFEKIQERRDASAQQSARWIEGPESDLRPLNIAPMYQPSRRQVVADK
jgi:hypothetical protein